MRFTDSSKASLSGARLEGAVKKTLRSVKICKLLATLGTGESKERQVFSRYQGWSRYFGPRGDGPCATQRA
jgi:hypothetical protein